jgi:hypothetical protein
MSRHHIQLPPLVYIPQPKPKKVEKRRRRGQIQADGSIKDAEETSEIDTNNWLSQASSTQGKSNPGDFTPIDGSERRRKQPFGLLSERMLSELLLVQEKLK